MKQNFTRVAALVLTFAFLLISLYGTAATITVSNGQSIQSAVDSASPGDIVSVQAGTYSQKVLFSGSADDGITLIADGVVTIDGTTLSPNGREGLITVSNSDNVRVEGFILRNFKTTSLDTPMGILVDNGSDNVQLIDNTIYNIENNRTNCNQNNSCYVGAHGIGVFGNTTNAITNILIQGNEVYNCDLMSSEAFVLNGNVDGFQIYDNIVRDNDNIGFDFIGYEPYDCSACSPEQLRVKNGLVAGNQAYRNSSGSNPHYTGDKSAGGFYVDGGRNIMFAGNISYENDFGFEFASEWNNRKTENILMVNNLVYNNTVTGLVMGGYSASTGNTGNGGGGGSAENIYVYNNTFYNNQPGPSYYATEITFQYRVINVRIANNIFYTPGNTSDIYNTWCGTCNNSNTGNVWTNNVWYGDGGTSGAIPESGGLKSNPLFTSTGFDFTLQSGSPAIGYGATQVDLTDWNDSFWTGFFYSNGNIPAHGTIVGSTVVDMAGNSRFQSTIDAGAYEFGSGSTTVSVTGVSVSPSSVSLTVGSTQSLSASISPSNATNQAVNWSSSNTSVATVNSSGVVTAQSAGSATITVTTTDGGFTDNTAITVSSSGGGTVTIDDEDFDSGWGIWNDGGDDALRISNSTYAASGTYSILIRDNTNTSVMTTDNLDLTAYSSITISFAYYARSMDNANEDFWLRLSTDGGSSFTTYEEWNQGDEFVNNQSYTDQVTITGPFTATTQLQFRCDASGNADYIYIDDVVISGTSSGGGTAPSAPSGLSATAGSSTQINLTWSDNSNDEDDFQVQRSTTGTGGWSQVAVASANATSFSNTGLSASTTYYYRVRARNSYGNSAWTSVSSATTQSGSGTSITIDGNSGDWSGISVLASNGGTSLKVYDDSSDIYFLLTGSLDAHSLVFVNTDNNSSGYTYSWSDGGMDYYIEDAGSLYDYTGTGSNWSWSSVSGAVTGATGSNVEFKVSKSSLSGLGSTIKVGVSIENSGWSQTNTVPATSNNAVAYVLGSAGSRLTDNNTSDIDNSLANGANWGLYPNPASSVINLKGVEEGQKIRVFNMLGEMILETSDLQINVSSLNPGIYLVKSAGRDTIKFVKR